MKIHTTDYQSVTYEVLFDDAPTVAKLIEALESLPNQEAEITIARNTAAGYVSLASSPNLFRFQTTVSVESAL